MGELASALGRGSGQTWSSCKASDSASAARTEMLRLMRRAAERFTAAQTEEELYRALLELVREATGAGAGAVHRRDGETLVPSAHYGGGWLRESHEVGDASLPGLATQRHCPIRVVRGGMAQRGWLTSAEDDDSSALSMPVDLDRDRQLIISLLGGGTGLPGTPRGEFTPGDIELVEALAVQMGPHLRRLETERLASVGQLAGSMVHDFKNSVLIIRGAAELCGRVAPETQRFVDLITTESDRMVEMMQELLDFARGNRTLKVQSVSLRRFLAEVAEAHRAVLERAQIELLLDIQAESAAFDPLQVDRALSNLIANARDAMPEGGTLTLRAASDAQFVYLSVQDTGVGMSPEVRKRLFEPFFTEGKVKGTGLGTAIVQRVAEGHGGQVEVLTAEGQGTTMTVCLPLRAN
ncbi:MAG: HAMP domain-containing histidine kinase [Armatimonadetes bacterium]|nr:HAMP domain-containing histidine kinase [Armatimonadota bacterium]